MSQICVQGEKGKKIAQNDTWVPSHIVNEYTDSCISVFEGHPSITCDKSALKVSQTTHLNFGVRGVTLAK